MKVYVVKSWVRRESEIEFVFSSKQLAKEYKRLRDLEIRLMKIENLAYSIEEHEIMEDLPESEWKCGV